VWVQPWDKSAVFSVEDSNFTTTEGSTTSLKQCAMNVDCFFWHWRHRA
jgi:hypothetical protein